MDEMQEKIGSILNNPQLMQQIMSMAQSMGAQPGKQEAPPNMDGFPEIDLAMAQKLSGLARQSGIDQREQALLRALGSYLSKDRVGRLERAMRAAKMAKIATTALGPGGLARIGR